MNEKISPKFLDVLFTKARTHNDWQDKKIEDGLLKKLYDLAKMAPTAANCQPMRLVFIKSLPAKERLKPFLSEGNVEKTMKAPVTAIVAYDTKFYEHLPFLFPQVDAKSWYEGNDKAIKETSLLNSSLQAAYLILAARSLGLDCGPMSGFDNKALDKEFFADGRFKSLVLCNLGYGNKETLYPRNPRFDFDEACKIL